VNCQFQIMKSLLICFPKMVMACALALFGTFLAATAATGATGTAPGKSSGSTNAAELEIPKSSFVVPNIPKDGKDPFFPRSTRVYGAGPVATTNVPTVVVADIHLNGISGSADHRLAIINNRTFESGEEAEVSTTSGRVRIRCLEIQAEAVVIQAGGERRVLRLRSGL